MCCYIELNKNPMSDNSQHNTGQSKKTTTTTMQFETQFHLVEFNSFIRLLCAPLVSVRIAIQSKFLIESDKYHYFMKYTHVIILKCTCNCNWLHCWFKNWYSYGHGHKWHRIKTVSPCNTESSVHFHYIETGCVVTLLFGSLLHNFNTIWSWRETF